VHDRDAGESDRVQDRLERRTEIEGMNVMIIRRIFVPESSTNEVSIMFGTEKSPNFRVPRCRGGVSDLSRHSGQMPQKESKKISNSGSTPRSGATSNQ
jgi:hypothetical protein